MGFTLFKINVAQIILQETADLLKPIILTFEVEADELMKGNCYLTC